MATFMYYPKFAGAPQQSQPMAAAIGTGVNNGLPPLVPYGAYYPHQAHVAAAPVYDQRQQAAYYGHSASYMVPSTVLQYMAVPPGLSVPLQAPSMPAAVSREQVNGGVSEVLDYDLENMTSFVVQNAYLLFGNEDLNLEVMEVFVKGVSSVLNATRLPSTTIYYALDYLAKYLGRLTFGVESIGGDSINVIYQNLMIAFVLANKFNDDKTFTNRSWSQATGMNVEIINAYEREWLAALNWRLFEDGFENYEAYREAFSSFDFEKKRQQQSLLVNSQLSASNLPVLAPPLPYPASNYYAPHSPFPQQGYQTPVIAKAVKYSSPMSANVKGDLFNGSCYPAAFSSPISNSSPLPKCFKQSSYYAQPPPANSIVSVPQGSFWNTPFDRQAQYQSENNPNHSCYCHSAVY
ncbi:HGR097Wp [Eremothecium sinecaudum]|uniref:HGR097Wp n=1 Tax=Eremothecium sinecaudum TaxID=45286 RepID=A0A0X8HVE6_9SACH|nr:HGR097Wp [Eremothecium sinecaudum]AMD22436.1 HGR097Wp [Eremothecium sinecaudum]